MKLFITIFSILFFSCGTQKATSSKYITTSFTVEGVCGMCEKRIESTLDIVGIESADWVNETSLLTVVFNPKKITENEMHMMLADAGHRTSKLEKNVKAYNSLPACCQYDDGAIKH